MPKTQPIHRAYSSRELRLDSFKKVPQTLYRHVGIDILVDAGFFYQGPGDRVRCFSCDGGLKNFNPGDDPWLEHASWFSTCEYLKSRKSEEYIRKAQPKAREREAVEYRDRQAHAIMATEGIKRLIDKNYDKHALEKIIKRNLAQTGDGHAGLQSLVSQYLDENEIPSNPIVEESKAPVLADVRKKIDVKPKPTESASTGGTKKLIAKNDDKALERIVKQNPTETGTGRIGSETPGGQNIDKEKAILQAIQSRKGVVISPKPIVQKTKASDPIVVTFIREEKELRDTHNALKETMNCVICADSEKIIAFLPCGHVSCCGTCSESVENCPICRQHIRGTVRIFT